MFSRLRRDMQAVFTRDPAARSRIEVLTANSWITADILLDRVRAINELEIEHCSNASQRGDHLGAKCDKKRGSLDGHA
jgi:hypothetical protein